MAENLISTTSKISMHALAWQGIAVYTCFTQIYGTVERKFGREVALLFAKPVENKATGEIDWYTPVNGTVRKLVDLPEAEKAPLYAKLASAAEEIQKYAEDELIRSGKSERVTRGEILKLALRYPDDNALLVVGEQPVMTCWGFGPGTPGVEGLYLSKLHYQPPARPAPQPAPEAPPVEPTPVAAAEKTEKVVVAAAPRRFGWGWLWWLFPLACLALLLLILFTSFGGLPAMAGRNLFIWNGFPFGAKDYSTELSALRNEVVQLEGKLREHVAMCRPKAVEPVAEGENLVIPEDSRNMEFLEGEWLCRTGLVNAVSGEPVQFSFTFNKNGTGHGTVHESDGNACTGPAQGSLENGVLRISLGEQKCERSSRTYIPLDIQCENVTGVTGTSCAGVNSDGTKWEATFHRLR